MRREYTIIVNPQAGRGRMPRLLPVIRQRLAELGCQAEIVISPMPDAPAELARAALDLGRCVVACGGDGLVGQLANEVTGRGGLFAVLPCGSGNDFARQLGLDVTRPLDALDVLLSGEEISVDMGRVHGKTYCTVAGTGFDAAAAAWAARVHWLSGTRLYVAAVLRTLLTYRPRRFRLTIDGVTNEIAAWLVAVANCRSYGGGMMVAPEANVDDGTLEVVTVGLLSRPDFLLTFPKVFKGTHVSHPQVQIMSGRRIAIEDVDDGPPLEIMADGERIGSLPCEIDVVPRSLRVIVPDPGTGEATTDHES